MHAIAFPTLRPSFSEPAVFAAKDRFRSRFQRSLQSCLRRGFSVEESFGLIWVETFEEIPLSEEEQNGLYDELIRWAKKARI